MGDKEEDYSEDDEQPTNTNRNALSCGVEFSAVPDLNQTLDDARAHSFEFILIPLVNPRYERNLIKTAKSDEPFTRSDMLLNSSQWGNIVVGKISSWLQLDSPLEKTRLNARKVND